MPDPNDVRTGNESLNGCGNQRPQDEILAHVEKFAAGVFEHLHNLAAALTMRMIMAMVVMMRMVRMPVRGWNLPNRIALHEEIHGKTDRETDG